MESRKGQNQRKEKARAVTNSWKTTPPMQIDLVDGCRVSYAALHTTGWVKVQNAIHSAGCSYICCHAQDCIAASARSAMVKADKQKPERYRFLLNDMLPPDESMPFTCSRCADPVKGPCFICRSAGPLTKVIETDEAESVLIKRSSAPEVVEQIPLHKAAPSKSGAYLNEKDNQSTTTGEASTLESTVIVIESQEKQVKKRDDDLLFRCTRCKLGFHYAHCEDERM